MCNLEPVVGPRSDFEEALLRVVGKVLDVHAAGGLVDGRRPPEDRAVEVDRRLRHQGHLVVAVRARVIEVEWSSRAVRTQTGGQRPRVIWASS